MEYRSKYENKMQAIHGTLFSHFIHRISCCRERQQLYKTTVIYNNVKQIITGMQFHRISSIPIFFSFIP